MVGKFWVPQVWFVNLGLGFSNYFPARSARHEAGDEFGRVAEPLIPKTPLGELIGEPGTDGTFPAFQGKCPSRINAVFRMPYLALYSPLLLFELTHSSQTT